MGGDKARKRFYVYNCPQCGWKGRRRGKGKTTQPCPKCQGNVHESFRGIGRPPQIGAKTKVGNTVQVQSGEYTSIQSVQTKLVPALIDSVSKAVRTSKAHVSTCAIALGIPEGTHHQWVKRGKDDIQNNVMSIFAEYVRATEKARAEGEIELLGQAEDLAKGNKASWMRTYRHLESWSRDRWVKSERLELEARLVDVDTVPDRPVGIGGFLDRARLQGGVAGELQAGAVDAEFAEIPVSDGTKGDKAAESSGDQVGTDAQMDQGPASSSEA